MAAWKAGRLWEDMRGEVHVFLEKDGEKIEVNFEKLIGKDGPRFWFKNKKSEPPERQPEKRLEDQSVTEDEADESTTEEVVQVMSVVDPGEMETGKKMWLAEKVTSLETKKKGELGDPRNESQD